MSTAVGEMREEDPAALVEMEERAKRATHVSLWDKVQLLQKFNESGLSEPEFINENKDN